MRLLLAVESTRAGNAANGVVVPLEWLVTGAGLLLLLIGASVIRKQAQAKSCPRHSRLAGRLAVPVGWGSVIGGLALLGYGLYLVGVG